MAICSINETILIEKIDPERSIDHSAMLPWELCIALLVAVFNIGQCKVNVNTVELMALKDIYEAANGQNWLWSSKPDAGAVWNFSVPDPNPCFPPWQGLTCSCCTELCWIIEIDLEEYNLVGILSEAVGNFTELKYLQLETNNLRSSIPDTIGNLENLEHLSIGYNMISGTLPLCLFALINLEGLSTAYNQINGTLPMEIGQLIHLSTLNVDNNLLTGQIPSSIGNLTSIQKFQVAHNYLNGTIPIEICQLKKLEVLDWSFNNFMSSIPTCMGELYNLSMLDLSSNMLTDVVPLSAMLRIENLLLLDLSSNLLSGGLINANSSRSKLRFLYLESNLLTGPLPGILLPFLEELYLDGNYFSGFILDSLCESDNLVELILSNNQVEGYLPTCLGTLPFLQNLDVSVNNLIGSIPETLTYHSIKGSYYLNNNHLSGTIPSSLCLWNLVSVNLGSNFFDGEIPNCSLNYTNGYNCGLVYFDVNNNVLSGQIPRYLELQKFLSTLSINNNMLSGSLPSFVNCSELVFVYVQDNQFHGTFTLAVNSSTTAITYVDISNNQFSGTLPRSLFGPNVPLQSFAASSNCFTGNIPSEICTVDSLLFLNLDGVATAQHCRNPIFPHVKLLTSYTLHLQIEGGIPLCLFNMSHLQTLHISGNSIEWSFPEHDFLIGSALTTLSLSHNKLTGTIPDVIQNKKWAGLDLSYNKLVGTLNFAEQTNASLVLQVNRLSGAVPDSLLQLNSINILTGNLFSCNFKRNGLPEHDTAYKIYQCGSNSFNQALIVWFCCATGVLFAVSIAWIFQYHGCRQFVTWFKQSWLRIQSYLLVFTINDAPFCQTFYQFKIFVLSVRNVLTWLTLMLLVVFMPLYACLTAFYKTATYQYAWTISAAFLSGAVPAIILLVSYMGFIMALFVVRLAFTQKPGIHSHPGDGQAIKSQTAFLKSSISFVVFVNCVVMVLVNGSYVVVILNYSSEIIFFAQVMTALFKLLWNDFAIRGMVSVVRRTLLRRKSTREISGENNDELNDVREVVDMPYLAFMVLFNSIIAPILATAAVDSNCFYNVFVAPTTVSSQFPFTEVCELSNGCNITSSASYIEVSYDPPFIYSYQCTSSILTNYASVYVFMFLMIAFIKPLALYVMLRCHSTLTVGSCIHSCIEVTIYKLLKPANVDNLACFQSADNSRKRKMKMFDRERFVLRTVGKIAVFVTFGVIFPPLAVVVCAAFVSETWLNLIMIGRFLALIEDENVKNKFRELLSCDCEDCTELLLVPLVRLVVPFAALFYGFFVFDIYGDEVGFKQAIWAPVLLVMFPVLLWLGHTAYAKSTRLKAKNEKSRTRSINNVEMLTVDNPVQTNEAQDKP